MNNTAQEIVEWCDANNMKVNPRKTQLLNISFKRSSHTWPAVQVKDTPIEPATSAKLLGVHINNKLTWDTNTDAITRKANQRVYFVVMLKRAGAPPEAICKFYTSVIRPLLEYACPVWHTSLTQSDCNRLESVQRRVMKIIHPDSSYSDALRMCRLQHLEARRTDLCQRFFAKIMTGSVISHILQPYRQAPIDRELRRRAQFAVRCRSSRFQNSFIPYSILHWQ